MLPLNIADVQRELCNMSGPMPSTTTREVPDPSPCRSCYKKITRPCAIVQLVDCTDCADRCVNCSACDGRKVLSTTRPDGSYLDCVVCAASGRLVHCNICNGQGSFDSRHNNPESRCGNCDGRGMLRCRTCDMAFQVWRTVDFCDGDGPESGPQRHHPNACIFPRPQWSEFEEPLGETDSEGTRSEETSSEEVDSEEMD